MFLLASLLIFVSITSYQGNRSILKITLHRRGERECLEVVASNCLPLQQLLAGWLQSGPGAQTLAALHMAERTSLPVCKIPPQLHVHWPVLLLWAPGCGMCSRLTTQQGFCFSHRRKWALSFLRSIFLRRKKKKKKSILFISPDFLEMGSRLVLARISAMLCKQRYFARCWICLLISSLKQFFGVDDRTWRRTSAPGRLLQEREGGIRGWNRQTERQACPCTNLSMKRFLSPCSSHTEGSSCGCG